MTDCSDSTQYVNTAPNRVDPDFGMYVTDFYPIVENIPLAQTFVCLDSVFCHSY
jgi:hypothetical protein